MIPRDPNAVALVTGGTRGIGCAVAGQLAAAGVGTIVLNYLQNDAAAALAQEAVGRNSRALLMKANVGSADDVDRLFARLTADCGRLDYLIHCAALTSFKPLRDTRPNQWDLTMGINARGFVLCVQRALGLMRGGAVVAVSSLGGRQFVPNYGAMGPAKAALEAAVRQLAIECAADGPRINAVTGGWIETDSIRKMPDSGAIMTGAAARTPEHRLGRPGDLADIVLFLLSPAARWIRGQAIVADGGASLC